MNIFVDFNFVYLIIYICLDYLINSMFCIPNENSSLRRSYGAFINDVMQVGGGDKHFYSTMSAGVIETDSLVLK